MDVSPADVMDFIFEFLSLLIGLMVSKLKVKPEGAAKFASCLCAILPLLSAALTLIDRTYLIDFLGLLHRGWQFILAALLLLAILPHIAARIEQKKHPDCVSKVFLKWNLIFNLFGAASAIGTFIIMGRTVGNMVYISDFPLLGITAILFTASVWVVLYYQEFEQELYKAGEPMDHDPSLVWWSQKFNVLFVSVDYFLALFSAEMVISYTFYCHIHGISIGMTQAYYLLLSIILVFFYSVSQHRLTHVYLVFLFCVPFIIVSSVYWFSWFNMSEAMRVLELVFIVGHFMIYSTLVFFRMGLVRIGGLELLEQAEYGI